MYLNGTKCFSLFLGCLASLSVSAKDAKANDRQGLKKPLVFLENKGQVTDQYNNTRGDIQFRLSTPGMSMYLGEGALHYQFRQTTGDKAALQVNGYRMDVTLLGANPHAQVITEHKQAYYETYYTHGFDKDGMVAGSYSKVTYKDVYPSIDWVLYVKDGKVEYDFVVRPGGNTADIQLRYDGATSLSIAAGGGINAVTPMGAITERTPYAYETKTGKAVASNFVLRDNVVSFAIAPHTGGLTIDPTLLWSTYFGNVDEDVVTGVTARNTTSEYITGYTASPSLASAGAYQTVNNGGAYDAFIAKYNAAGALQWATYYGGGGLDEATGITHDLAGNVFITGYTTSTLAIAAGPSYQTTNGGGTDAFLAKFSSAGAILWSTYFGGSGEDFGYAVTCDASNNVYMTGSTGSSSAIATATAFQSTLNGASDAFIAKFTNVGGILWATYFGGSVQEQGNGIATDLLRNVVITGQTNSTDVIATPGAYQTTLNGVNDAFIAKLDSDGNRIWSTYYGGESTDMANGIACDLSANIFLVGNTASTTGMASAHAFQSVYGGDAGDAFVAGFDAAGNRTWGTYYGGAGLDNGRGICVDNLGNVDITGNTYSTAGIASTYDCFQNTIGGASDAFVAKFDALGGNFWGTYFGSTSDDYGNGIAVDANGRIVIGGNTSSTTGIATTGATVYGGGTYDGFATEFKADTLVHIQQPYIDTLVCVGNQLTIVYIATLNFSTVNIFSVELSDASGVFPAVPVVIGTITSNVSGFINCTIPAGTTPGTGYRVRITASAPQRVSPDDFYALHIINTLPPTMVSGTTPICSGATLYLFDSSLYNIPAYSWSGPAGFSSASQNPSIAMVDTPNAGTYTLITSHNGCPDDTSSINIVVNTTIPPTPADSAGPACLGDALHLYASSSVAGVTYSWSGPAGFTSTMQDPVIPAAGTVNSGYYYLVDTLGGCASAMDSILVTVMPHVVPSVTITAHPGDTVCAGGLLSFTVAATNAGLDPQYQWMTGVNTPVVGAISSVYGSTTFVTGDTILLVLTSSAACASPLHDTSNIVVVTVLPDIMPTVMITALPDSTVAPGEAILFEAVITDGGVFPGYQWQINGVAVPGATSSTFSSDSLVAGDHVSLVITSTETCTTPSVSSNVITIDNTSSVANVSAALAGVVLYPNPNNGSFTVKGALNGINAREATVEVSNVLGQVICKNTVPVDNNKLNKALTLDNEMTAGIYTLHITADGQSKVIRFTVQR